MLKGDARSARRRIDGLRRSIRKLGPQLFLHEDDLVRRENWPVRNDRNALGKPRGGFWTSSYDPEYGSAWVCGASPTAITSRLTIIGRYCQCRTRRGSRSLIRCPTWLHGSNSIRGCCAAVEVLISQDWPENMTVCT